MSTMTLEQARDLLASYLDDRGCHIEAENVRKGIDLESYENELKLVGWMYRHTRLAQAAQAVDVGAIREVIDRLRINPSITAQECADILAVALSGEKAAPVVRITVDSVAMAGCDDACQVWLRSGVQHFQVGPAYETRDEGEWYASQLRIALGLPASPAPDKEGI